MKVRKDKQRHTLSVTKPGGRYENRSSRQVGILRGSLSKTDKDSRSSQVFENLGHTRKRAGSRV